jgi:hypothetical protein
MDIRIAVFRRRQNIALLGDLFATVAATGALALGVLAVVVA